MVMELKVILTDQSMLANGKMEKLQGVASSPMQMEAAMGVKYQKTKQTAMELSRTKMVRNSLEHGSTIFRKVKGLNSCRMAVNIQATFVRG